MKPISQFAFLMAVVGAVALSGCAATNGDKTVNSIMRDREERARVLSETNSNSTVEARSWQPAGTASARKAPASEELPVLSGNLNLPDAVRLAMANNHALRTVYLTKVEADGEIMRAYAGALPKVNANASAQTTLPREDGSDTYALGVEVVQPLWRSGAVGAALRYAKLYAASTDFTIREQVQATVYGVVSKYMDVLLNMRLVQVYEEANAVSERLLQTARNRRAQGTVSDYEVLRADVEVANTKAALINANNALQSSIVSLFQTMGVSQYSNVEFTGTLAYTPEQYFLDDTLRTAATERPDLARAQAALRMAEENVKIVRAEYGPSADAFAGGEYSNLRNDDWDDEWMAGARVSLKLFDGFERRGKMISAISRRDQAAESLRDLEYRAHVEVVNALLNLKYADELYQSQMKNIDLAKEALRILETGSSFGRNTQVEVLDARAALTQAMGTYYNAVHAHGLARLGVRRAKGTLSPETTMDDIVSSPTQGDAQGGSTQETGKD